MKLAFSTLGCPDFDWSDIYSMAKDFGFDGIELRGLGDEIFSIHARPFREENIDGTVKQLRAMKLEISCLSSGCFVGDPERADEACAELREYIDTAARLGTKYIRVLGDDHAQPTR